MERMLDLITKRECDFLTYLDQYHGQRIVVCGAAAGGERICALLKKKGIKNFTVAVEKRYFHEGQVVYGRKVESFESVMKGIMAIRMPYTMSLSFNVYMVIKATANFNSDSRTPMKA